MKRFFLFLFGASLIMGCSSSEPKTNPLIEAYLLEHIANPDTYKPGDTEIIQQGTIDVDDALNWRDIPAQGDIDVVILRHKFTSVDVSGEQADNAFIFYMSPEEDVIYYAHKDKGILLFPLD